MPASTLQAEAPGEAPPRTGRAPGDSARLGLRPSLLWSRPLWEGPQMLGGQGLSQRIGASLEPRRVTLVPLTATGWRVLKKVPEAAGQRVPVVRGTLSSQLPREGVDVTQHTGSTGSSLLPDTAAGAPQMPRVPSPPFPLLPPPLCLLLLVHFSPASSGSKEPPLGSLATGPAGWGEGGGKGGAPP